MRMVNDVFMREKERGRARGCHACHSMCAGGYGGAPHLNELVGYNDFV